MMSHSAPRNRRGRIIGEAYVQGSAAVPGEAGEVFCLNSNLGERYLLTTDGLYIGALFQDTRGAPDTLPETPRRGVSINGCTAGGESFGGEFFRNPLDGKVYIGGPVSLGRETAILGQVVGLDRIRRLPDMTITYTPQQHAEAVRLFAERAQREAAAKSLAIVRAKKPLSKAPEQGDFDWNDRRVARWSFDARHAAEATWTYDGKNLYLCVRGVPDDTPMINGGNDVTTLFKTGDAVEFDLRTQPNKDDKQVIEGDLRLVLSVYEKKPVVVVYRYKVPGAGDCPDFRGHAAKMGLSPSPVVFSSPVGKVRIDQVQVLSDAQVVFDRHPTGYTLRAAVPLASLGFSPAAGKIYHGDIGVVYSDRTGTINELRMYWANQISGMVNDLPTEANVVPANWGRFVVEE
jgi:hypothetical protein